MTYTMKHTPGRHRVEQVGRRPLMKAVNATVLSSSGERLADFRHVADANLFAAAPALVEALRVARAAFNVEYHEDGRVLSVGYDSEALRPLVVLLDAALASVEDKP